MKKILFEIFSRFLRQLVVIIGRTVYRINTSGAINIPKSGGALLVANHASYLDFILIVSSIPRPVRFVMNADIFMKPGLKWILQGLQCIPIAAREGKNNFEDFNETVRLQIEEGNIVVIFAEGTVSRTGQLLEFKKGVEHLSRIISAPIIPIHFHNVQGSPFSFRGGNNRMEKFSLKTLRKDVRVFIGEKIDGPIKAFTLRQKIKELEVSNFDRQVSCMKPLDQLLSDKLTVKNKGYWNDRFHKTEFSELSKKLNQLDIVLRPLLQNDKNIGILLPKTGNSLLINLWIIINKRISINIDPATGNETRLYICNKSNCDTIITTKDLNFTRYAPNAGQIIYIEDVLNGIESGKPVSSVCTGFRKAQRQVKQWFDTTSKSDDVVAIFFEENRKDDIQCIKLTHKNLLAALTSLRQVYYFIKGSRMLSNLNLYDAYGFVLELLLPLLSDLQVELISSSGTTADFGAILFDKKPELIMASPTLMQHIAEMAQLKNIPFLTHVFTADLHPDNHTIKTLTNRNIEVMVCAGKNETSSVFAVNLHNYHGRDIAGEPLEQENNMYTSIGKPLPGIALKVCDPNDPSVEFLNDETGTIWLKGPAISPAGNIDNSSKSKMVNTWFNSGLIGSINHKGFVSINN